MKNKLIIFDLDGTLANTTDVNYCAYNQALSEVGLSVDYDYFCEYCNGRHYLVFLNKIMQGKTDKIEFVHQRKKQLYSQFLDKSIPNAMLCEYIDQMCNVYYMAVVTTASKKNCDEVLKKIGVFNKLDLILTQEDVDKKKPDPEGFLKAMNYFKLDGKDTTIFEDSDVGVEAALSTGAQVFRLLNFSK